MNEIKEHPMLFSGEMVKAILSGQKTMTRRVMKPQPMWSEGVIWQDVCKIPGFWTWKRSQSHNILMREGSPYQPAILEHCPYGRPGEQLWVRETFLHATYISLAESGDHQVSRSRVVEYVADGAQPRFLHPGVGGSPYMQKRPSIFMPRWASRLTLEIVGVKVERLQDISEEDAVAEGVGAISIADMPRQAAWSARHDFSRIWDAINAKQGFTWKSNPWVWCISFRRMEL